MKLTKQLFDQWGHAADKKYADKQWLLSKWEVNEGIDWPSEKIDMLIDNVRCRLELKAQGSLIELGCGGGWLLERLSPDVQRYYGLDFSLEMMKFASVNLRGHLIGGEIGRLPFSAQQFDHVLSYYVFMNFDDEHYIKQSLKEIYRVLKTDGRALIGQLPDVKSSSEYEKAKEDYFQYCEQKYSVGKSIREEFKPPLKLFDKDHLVEFLRSEKIQHSFEPSFNPFYYAGQNKTVDWRFDLILKK